MLTQAMEYYTTFYPQKLAINTVDQEGGTQKPNAVFLSP